jgi:ribosomal protein S18 acetylase RimI-like enzyme
MPVEVQVVLAGPGNLPDLLHLFRAAAAAEEPANPAAADRAAAGLQRSLDTFDWLRSDSCWLLLAWVGGEPAGFVLAVRIPKADERAGYLFVDEVYVLPACRRTGVARALLARVQELAGELGLAGVRLLVRPENTAARTLYRSCGFEEGESVFCQWQGARYKVQGRGGKGAA